MRRVVGTLLLLAWTAPAGATGLMGCASRGGPGFRLPDGNCASWKQSEHYCDSACYPAGTKDERDQPAPKPPLHKAVKP